jgi:hypothetical protein
MNDRIFSDLVAKAESDADSAVNRTLQLIDNHGGQVMLLAAVAAQFVGLFANAVTLANMKKLGELPDNPDDLSREKVCGSPYTPEAVTLASCLIRRMSLTKMAFDGGDDSQQCFNPRETMPLVLDDFKALTGKEYSLSTFNRAELSH